jgi:hypothetical protein
MPAATQSSIPPTRKARAAVFRLESARVVGLFMWRKRLMRIVPKNLAFKGEFYWPIPARCHQTDGEHVSSLSAAPR